MHDKLYSAYRKWSCGDLIAEEGIVVGADATQEWLLPWWWERYLRFNSHPVVFVDFGLSETMKEWCKARGKWIRLPVGDVFVAEKEQIQERYIQEWEGAYGRQFWISRNGWFKKPMACLLSPFRKSIWIDIDCEIRGPLKELFKLCDRPSGIAIAKELFDPLSGMIGFNSGVIVFKRGIPLIEEWADQVFERNEHCAGDQDVLSNIIHEKKLSVAELPLIYNWSRLHEENPEAVIFHWHGRHGKTVIAHQISQSEKI